ncbi:MAG: serine hydrolase [Candidatus Saccharibacteria bacterium]
MLICPKCSHVNSDISKTCIYCGASLIHNDAIPRKPSQDVKLGPVSKERPKSSNIPRLPKKLVAVVLAVIIISSYTLLTYQPVLEEPSTRPVKINLDYSAQARDLPLTSNCIVLMEPDTGAVLYTRNPDLQTAPASTTKLMTMLLAVEAMEKSKVKKYDTVTASEQAALADGARIYLQKGEQLTFRDMMRAVAVHSANDAAIAVAEHVGGDLDTFVQQMNRKAQELGMKNTHFANVNGMPIDNHYVSARDMAILGSEAVKHPQIFEYTTIKECKIRDGTYPISNTNRLLWWYPGVDGLKTGWTSKAKHCVVATAKKGDLRLVAAVFANPRVYQQFNDSIALFDYGFSHYSFPKYSDRHEKMAAIKVWFGKSRNIDALASDTIGFITPKGSEKDVTFHKTLMSHVVAPVKKGTRLGYVDVNYKGKLVKRVYLTADKDIPAFWQ